jgi:hypothetical protein
MSVSIFVVGARMGSSREFVRIAMREADDEARSPSLRDA